MKKILIAFTCVFSLACFFITNIKTEARRIFYDDYYAQFGDTTPNKKIIVDVDVVPYLEDMGIVVSKDLKKKKTLFNDALYDYYYYTNEFIGRIVTVRSLDNDMDSFIYMVKQLENYAVEYKKIQRAKYPISELDATLCVSELTEGYIRAMNINYTSMGNQYEGFKMMFEMFAKKVDKNFVKYVNEKEESKKLNPDSKYVTLLDYFKRFVDQKFFNEKLYGDAGTWDLCNLKDIAGESKIDVPHMFIVMDIFDSGISTEANTNYAQCVMGYLGDLQKTCHDFYNKKEEVNYLNFKETFLDKDYSGFDMADYLADLDGMILGHNYIHANEKDGEKNLVSDSMIAYYNTIRKDPTFRYKAFIHDAAYHKFDNNGIDEFIEKTTFNMYLKKDFSNTSGWYILSPYYKMLHENDTKQLPSYEVRRDMTKGFIKYTLEKAGYIDEANRI